jgi:hypothetical protein
MKNVFSQIAFLACLAFAVSTGQSFGQTAKYFWQADYEGKLGNEAVGMTLTLDGDPDEGKLTGKIISATYFYVKHLKDIKLQGKLNGDRNFVFDELDANGNVAATLTGKFLEKDEQGRKRGLTEYLRGEWQKKGETTKQPFLFVTNSFGVIAADSNRYAIIDAADDAEFERRVQAFRNAVLKADKQFVANAVRYPISVFIGKRQVKMRKKAQFLKNYNRIFDREFVARIKAGVPHNMFARYDGAMIGNGDVWFWGDGKVIALNN